MASTLAQKTVLNAIYISGAASASRFWLGGLGAILMLHHVREEPAHGFLPNAHLSVSPGFLERVITTLKARGVEFVSMDEAIARMKAYQPKRWQTPFVTITLDDGYRDNLHNAVPLFHKHKVPYTIYVAPGLVDGEASLWWEDVEAAIAARERFVLDAPKGRVAFDVSTQARKRRVFGELMDLLSFRVPEAEQRRLAGEISQQCGIDQKAHVKSEIMDWAQIAELSNDRLCTIGAHTIGHYALARLEADAARFELEESARIIEMETGRRPAHFAFPYGYPAAAGKRDFELAQQAGFATAVTTRHGVLYPGHIDHLHALPRISLNGRFQSIRYVDALLSGLPTRLQNRGRALNVA